MSYIITREELKRLHPQWEAKIADVRVAPQYDRVLCWRISEEEKAGSIILPQTTTTFRARAVILAFGLKAADQFYAHGTELGDVVTFAEYAGNDKMTTSAHTADGQRASFLWLMAADILGNESLADRLAAGAIKPVRQGEKHKLADLPQTMTVPSTTTTTAALDPI